jgi:hypothetical protein
LPGRCATFVKHHAHAQLGEQPGDEVEATHGHPAAQDEHIVRVQMQLQARAHFLRVIAHVIVGDALEAMTAQSRDDAVDIGTSDLVRQHRLARLDEFIAGGEHRQRRLGADPHPGHAGAGGNRHLGCTQAGARFSSSAALARIGAAAMNVVPRFGIRPSWSLGNAGADGNLLHRDHGCRSPWAASRRS